MCFLLVWTCFQPVLETCWGVPTILFRERILRRFANSERLSIISQGFSVHPTPYNSLNFAFVEVISFIQANFDVTNWGRFIRRFRGRISFMFIQSCAFSIVDDELV